MKIKIISVGKKSTKEIASLVENYQQRLKRSCELLWIFLPTSNIDGESAAILKQIGASDYMVLLDQNGNKFSSTDFAATIEQIQNDSTKQLIFVIGGAFGINHNVIERSNLVISLSDMVFPHQLVRLILIEQIYRAYTILSGSKYHHE